MAAPTQMHDWVPEQFGKNAKLRDPAFSHVTTTLQSQRSFLFLLHAAANLPEHAGESTAAYKTRRTLLRSHISARSS